MRVPHPLFTTIGLPEPEYDLPLQIRTLEIVREDFPHTGLVIIGSGSLDGKLRRVPGCADIRRSSMPPIS